jgi:cell pole-organizing protein PopZ
MAYHSGGVLIEELDKGAAAPAEVITESDSDADEGPAAGVVADSAASQSQIDDASCYQAASPPLSDAALTAAAAEAAVRALANVPVPAFAVFSDASGAPYASVTDTATAAHSTAAAAALDRLAASISGVRQPEQSVDWGPSAQSETFPHGEGPALDRQPIIQEIAQDAPDAAPRLSAAAALAACALFGYDAALEVRLPRTVYSSSYSLPGSRCWVDSCM